MSRRATAALLDMAIESFPDWDDGPGRPKALSLAEALRLCLIRLRRNATFQDLHEDFAISTSTAWAYHQTMVTFLAEALGAQHGDLPELLAGQVVLVDGTLVPTFHWRHRSDLLSGKHRRRGVNIQVLSDLFGRLRVVSTAFPGSWHDIHCLRETGWLDFLNEPDRLLGDTGYIGEPGHLTTPIKKKPKIDLTDEQKHFNTQFARLRVAAEWTIAHLKNWRLLSTRYRSDLSRIDTDIAAIAGLQRLNETHAERRLTFERIRKAVSE